MKLCEIIQLVDSEFPMISTYGNNNIDLQGLNLCNRKSEKKRILSYVTSRKYADNVKEGIHIVALLVKSEDAAYYRKIILSRNGCLIICEKPETVFYQIHEALCRSNKFYDKVDSSIQIGKHCNIHKTAVIEEGVKIGDNVTIGPNTVIRSGTVIDNNTIIGCNTTIGSEGFQIIVDGDNTPMHITHVGKCHISSDVCIGDNVCICNSLFEGETYIGPGVRIDNLAYVAHNLYIGKNAVITAHVVLCGSSIVEEGAWIAPNSSVLNRVIIGKYSKVGMGSVVTRNVEPYTVVYGSPARIHKKSN